MRCGLVHWCERARGLQDSMPPDWYVTIGVLGDGFKPSDCPGGVAVPITDELRQALHALTVVLARQQLGAAT